MTTTAVNSESRKVCSVPNCPEPVLNRGLCSPHYQRLKRHGSPTAGGPPRPRDLERRLWQRVNKDGLVPEARPELGACWIWTGPVTGFGYGNIGGSDYVHRLSYEIAGREIPSGYEVDHLCQERLCVNPAHLEAVTPSENRRRAQARKTHCPNNHAYDVEIHRRGGIERRCSVCTNARRRERRQAANKRDAAT